METALLVEPGSAGSGPFLEMRNVSKTFPGVKALDRVELRLRRGEVHALVGENGAGKSTLIKILAGVEKPDPGAQIFVEGKDVKLLSSLDSTHRGIAVIYQDFSLFPNLTVAENIAFGREISEKKRFINWREIREAARQALTELQVNLDLDVQLEKLSAARQQLVAIARALVFNAKLIVMDEPTSSLSASEVNYLFEVIHRLLKKGIGVLFVSHKLHEVFRIAERITVLRDGKYIGTFARDEVTVDQVISLMVGREVAFTKKYGYSTGAPLLEVRSLSKRGNFRDISFALHKREILGLTGLVGAGRSELAQALYGLNSPDSGEVYLEGRRVTVRSPEEALRLGIAYMPENRQREGLLMRLPVAQNISVSVLDRIRNAFGMLDRYREKRLAQEYIKLLGIKPPNPDMLAMNLSGGNQQRLVMAKMLAISPKVLIADEPTQGVDVGAKAEIHELLQSMATRGMGILLVSSDLPEVLNLSDRILVMRKGRIVAEFAASEATQEKIMSKAVLGGADQVPEEAQQVALHGGH